MPLGPAWLVCPLHLLLWAAALRAVLASATAPEPSFLRIFAHVVSSPWQKSLPQRTLPPPPPSPEPGSHLDTPSLGQDAPSHCSNLTSAPGLGEQSVYPVSPWLNSGAVVCLPSCCLWCLVLAALDEHWVEEPVWHSTVLEVPGQCGPSQSQVLGLLMVLGGLMAGRQDFCWQLAYWPLLGPSDRSVTGDTRSGT